MDDEIDNLTRFQSAQTVEGHHLVFKLDLFNRLFRAIGQQDQCAGRKTGALLMVTNRGTAARSPLAVVAANITDRKAAAAFVTGVCISVVAAAIVVVAALVAAVAVTSVV
ncbi:hypothetical protein M0H32_23350 [Roseibium sp. CAU 1639]|uniref:Uncharacterized protein n=1 Tax=Roseibium sediminicola TaxID=2933272 RepID=A0ABT0H094_9HYPH|nr:hypothetical protein [Roseibium sp. CAU 1639]MCK7615114.1 hypothetical protein [Roseibium sp. CAU 1639]